MLHELTITAPNQSGFFSRIMMAVRRRGYQPSAQKREVRGDTQVVTLTLEGAENLLQDLVDDIKALGTVVTLTATQPTPATTIRVGRQVIEVSPRPESTASKGSAPQPPASIRVGRQVLQVDPGQVAASSQEEEASHSPQAAMAHPAGTIRAGRQILDPNARPATQAGRGSVKSDEYADEFIGVTGMAT